MNRSFVISFFIFCFIVNAISGRELSSENTSTLPPKLSFYVEQKPELFSTGSEGEIILSITVPERYHIYGGNEFSVEVDCKALKVKEIIYPKPEIEEDFVVYRGDIKVIIKASPLDPEIKGILKINWQGCQDFGDKICFMPTTSKVDFEIKVKNNESKVKEEISNGNIKQEKGKITKIEKNDLGFSIFNNFSEKSRFVGFKSPDDFKKWFESVEKGEIEKENLFSRMAKENILFAIFIAFFFGFLSSLTPCVYPIIPITIAYIGSKSQGKGKYSGFFLSLFFVLGLALVYSSFGVASSFLGVSFGSLTQKPIIGITISFIFALLGLSMLGLFEIAMPSKLTSKIEEKKKKGKGYLGAFLIGALSGLVASPCIGPLLLAILVIVASLGSVILGFVYLFSFALGMGVLFIVIGTFSAVISSLPKSGNWMDLVKVIFGALIFGGSFYFLALYLSKDYFFLISGLFIGFISAFLLFGKERHFLSKPFPIVGIFLIIAVFISILFLVPLKEKEQFKESLFETNITSAAEKALKENKPLLIDFRADWCVACVELEKKTWPSEESISILKNVVPLKTDFTVETEETKELTKLFKIEGLPTVVLLVPKTEVREKNGD